MNLVPEEETIQPVTPVVAIPVEPVADVRVYLTVSSDISTPEISTIIPLMVLPKEFGEQFTVPFRETGKGLVCNATGLQAPNPAQPYWTVEGTCISDLQVTIHIGHLPKSWKITEKRQRENRKGNTTTDEQRRPNLLLIQK